MPDLAIPQRQITFGAIDQNFHRCVGAGQPRCQPRQIAGIASLGGQRRHDRADARPGEIQVAIGRIVGEADPGLLEGGHELRFRNMQKRARQKHAIAFGLPRHRRQTGDAAAAQHAHQQRLGLIVTGVRGEDMGRATGPRGLRQQMVSRRPRRSGQSGFRLGAGPSHRAMRQFEAARQKLDGTRLGRGFRTQAMIDGDGEELRPARQSAAPADRKPHQGKGVRTAGDRKHDRRNSLPVREQTFRILCRDR